MKKVMFTILASALLQVQAQQIKGLCLSPPETPVFRVLAEEDEPVGAGRGAGYAVPFDTLRFNQVIDTHALDVVICIDGVTNANQIEACDRYVDSLIERLQAVPHYQSRFKYFNIYRIAKLSNESGAAWGFFGDTTVDNRYGSRFNAFGLPRLLIPVKYDTLFADITQYVPHYDLALMMVHDKLYGGAGWNLYDGRKVATFSLEEESGWHLGDEIIIHEMQHIMPFAGHGYLGDEYEDSLACLIYDTIPESPNFTPDSVNQRKWQHCMGLLGIGFYPDAGICEDNYRPTEDCIMHRVFGFPAFCPVCRENSTAWLDSMINPVYNPSANAPDFMNGSHIFSVQVDTPVVNTYRYQWLLDNNQVALNALSHTINFDTIDKSQNHILKFVCTDVDPNIIDTSLRRPWVVQWDLLTYDSTVSVPEVFGAEEVFLFPNPAKNRITIQLPWQMNNIRYAILSSDGRIWAEQNSVSGASFEVNIQNLVPGVYMLMLETKHGKAVKKFAVD